MTDIYCHLSSEIRQMSIDDDPSTPLLDDQDADDPDGITEQAKIKITEALPCR